VKARALQYLNVHAAEEAEHFAHGTRQRDDLMKEAQPSPAITYVDDKRLVALIGAAETRIVYVAPGISKVVAEALTAAMKRLGGRSVAMVLDVDPEVCRMGFGSMDGLELLHASAQKHGTMVCHQPGLRIGVLVVDGETVIFSPPALLIEGGSNEASRPNAIALPAPPAELARDLGLNSDEERQIGLDAVKPEKIAAVAADIAANPPLKFDVTQQLRVFNSRFQFVEFEMTGLFLSRKKAPIPADLLGLARDERTKRRLHASFDLVGRAPLEVAYGDYKLSEAYLRDRKQEIIRQFLVTLKGYGAVILRANKDKFTGEVEKLRVEVKAFREGVKAELDKQMDVSRKALMVALLPSVQKNPPPAYTKIYGPHPDEAVTAKLLEGDIKRAFGTAEKLIGDMDVKCVFKDVTYESLSDVKFIQIARAAMPGVKFLHDEFTAAKEAKPK
jgi:hypothetical protein